MSNPTRPAPFIFVHLYGQPHIRGYVLKEANAYMDHLETENLELRENNQRQAKQALAFCRRLTELEGALQDYAEGKCGDVTPYHPQEHERVREIDKLLAGEQTTPPGPQVIGTSGGKVQYADPLEYLAEGAKGTSATPDKQGYPITSPEDVKRYEGHTPGPWVSVNVGEKNGCVIVGRLSDEHDNPISQGEAQARLDEDYDCKLYTEGVCDISLDSNDDPRANARLITDAPKLLADYDREHTARVEAEADLAVSRKIRRYVAFVLTGDEEADVQLAADTVKAQLKRAVDALRALDDVAWEYAADQSGEPDKRTGAVQPIDCATGEALNTALHEADAVITELEAENHTLKRRLSGGQQDNILDGGGS